MKTASGPLRTLIESGQFFQADLYTITLIDGTIIRYTSADIPLSFGGNTFLRFGIERDKIKVALGFSVDNMKVQIAPLATDLISGIHWGQAIRTGLLDGAQVLIEKAYLSVWPTIVGTLHGFQGNISDIDGSRSAFQLQVKSALELLNIDMPRNLYQGTCNHIVYDAGCTLLRSSFTVTGSVSGSPSFNGIATALGQAAGYFDQGVLAFTSGPNNGSRRTVKSFASGAFSFAFPLPALPTVGDTFAVYPGCDRTQATCIAKFSNAIHFKGYPFVPTPETAF